MPMTLSALLLDWYDQHRRLLPWRTDQPDPYAVWLSEVMLQQTTVAAVIPYYQRFLARWPTVMDLARADDAQVMKEWAGLGYYARARNLLACARAVAAMGGSFPPSEAQLRDLPGIGTYTAAAIAAIAFNLPANVVDGNVERVMARLHAVTTPLPPAKAELSHLAAALAPHQRPGDYAQALMDLGATLCTPRSPRCNACPWAKACQALAQGQPEAFPVKRPKAPKPTRFGLAFWLQDDQNRVLLRRRPPKGLLGGMMEIPTTPWRPQQTWILDEAAPHAPAPAHWLALNQTVHHTFTHFHLELGVVKGLIRHDPSLGLWCPLDQLAEQGLPTLMTKITRLCLPQGSSLK